MSLLPPDYTYLFDNIQSHLGLVTVTDHRRGELYQLQVSVNDSQLVLTVHTHLTEELADLVDLAVAVYTADRLSARQGDTPCTIQIVLPVRRPAAFSQCLIQMLEKNLLWFTQDNWSLSFIQRTGIGRPIETQNRFVFESEQPGNHEVALWSGGLDSLSGYCNRLMSGSVRTFTLFGTGGNDYVLNVQRTGYQAVKRRIPEARNTNLIQVPIHLSVTTKVRRNRIMRARGFVFLLLGAVCALTQGHKQLAIYENGIGAINLPFRLSEVGLDHTRAVNPLSLIKMSALASTYTAKDFVFWNPFLFWTKAQMCKVFVDTSCTELVFATISCDRRFRSKPMQCGRCSSCLLRRQALAVQQVYDRTGYVVLRNPRRMANRDLHLRAMLYQIGALRTIYEGEHPWRSLLRRYPILQSIVDELSAHLRITAEEVQSNLLFLYQNYVREWDMVAEFVSEGILYGNETLLAGSVEYDRSGGFQDGLQYT